MNNNACFRIYTGCVSIRMVRTTAFLMFLVSTAACSGNLEVEVSDDRKGSEAPTAGEPVVDQGEDSSPGLEVSDRSPLVVASGNKITLMGTGFKVGLMAASIILGEQTALAVEVESETRATITMPESSAIYGMTEISLTQDGKTQRISVFVDGGKTDFPLFSGASDKVCSDEKFYNASGDLVQGTKDCGSEAKIAECQVDGEVGCVTTESVRGAVVSGLAGKILVGQKVAGIDGSVPAAPGACAVGGETNCIANDLFPGVDSSKLVASNIKSGVTIASVAGDVVPRPSDCVGDGEVGCVTSSSFLAANMANFSDGDVRDGVVIAGITGSLVGAPSSCASDGETACLANNSFRAAAVLNLADKVLNGQVVASVSGNVTLPPVGKVYTGITYGVAGTGSTGTLTVPAAGDVLTGSGTYGDPDALVTPSYSPDFPDVANVLGPDTVDGVAGTLTLPTVGNVLTGTGAYGAGGTALTPTLTLPAVGKVYTGITYGVAGTGSTGTLTVPAAGDVLTGSGTYGDPDALVTPSYSPDFPAVANVLGPDTVDGAVGTLTLPAVGNVLTGTGAYGAGGTALTPTLTLPSAANVRVANGNFGAGGTGTAPSLADCGSDGDTSCVVDDGTNYVAAASSNLVAANIRRGQQIGGILGNFPSSTSPLPRFSGDAPSTAVSGSDETDLTNFSTDIKVTGTYEYWDSSGIRRTGSGDNDISAENIKNGIAFENLSVTGSYTAAATEPAAWDLRAGVTVGSVTGKLKVDCRNAINSSIYNYDGSLASLTNANYTSGTAFDWWDTIDNGAGVPSSVGFPGAWSVSNNYCAGIEAAAGDDNVWKDLTSDGTCDASGDECVFQDKITGLIWAEETSGDYEWIGAPNYCDTLSFGSQSDWRLPTQMELFTAYTHGMKDLEATNFSTDLNRHFWSSTSHSSVGNSVSAVSPGDGTEHVWSKNNWAPILCVRP